MFIFWPWLWTKTGVSSRLSNDVRFTSEQTQYKAVPKVRDVVKESFQKYKISQLFFHMSNMTSFLSSGMPIRKFQFYKTNYQLVCFISYEFNVFGFIRKEKNELQS